ncbi:hypothetical protein D3C85_1442320 [compost metagenome]
MSVHRRGLVDAEVRRIERNLFFLSLLEVRALFRVVDAELVFVPEDAFLAPIRSNEVDVLAHQLAHRRSQQRRVLCDQVNI